ncbi:MAG: OsmC family protein [Alistipes sp.]|nr:OsmC family protein [Alistipes sp.]
MKQKVTLCLTKDGTFTLTADRNINDLNPKELLLCSAAECAGLTLYGILQKEHIRPLKLEITVAGELNTDTVMGRSVFTSFHVGYNVECRAISEQAKIGRAINLATEKYCGLIQMLRQIAPLSHEVSIMSVETVEA